MNGNSNFGVCFCEYTNGHPQSFNLFALISYIQNLSAVSAIWFERDLILSNNTNIVQTIRKNNIDRILIIGNRPGYLKAFFSGAMRSAGSDHSAVFLFSLLDHGIYTKGDQDRARAMISGIIYNTPYMPVHPKDDLPFFPDTVIIGAGIAGIQASLEIANGGHKVHLIEKSSSIGGHMAMFDKTFPTLDCAACILTPKMVEVGQHPNIDLLTLSEVIGISGHSGNFKVKVRKKARYVTEKCTGCGECTKVCPVEVPNEFELGLVKRKAIYRNFPQATPNIYAISREGMPLCKLACPIGQDVEGYIALTARGKFREAYELIRRTNALPSICGRVCYHKCEEACKRAYLDEPVSIRNLKRYITEKYTGEKIQLEKEDPSGKKVAIIGSGPSGLACAHDLVLKGHEVTIFEKQKRAGGMMITGIPEFRLPRKILDQDIGFIEQQGVRIQLNTQVGKDIQFEDLKKDYDAVYLATGAHKSLEIGLDNENASGVLHGVDYLRMVNLKEDIPSGENVIVIGGGNTAIDSARVALRLGAKNVNIVYRRSKEEMPATPEEIREAEEEGIGIVLLAAPKQFKAKDGRIKKVRFANMKLGAPDESGRKRPVEIPGSGFDMKADLVIIAVSQKPEIEYLKEEQIKVSKWDTLVVNEADLGTDLTGCYAGGDAVSGPSSVVEAMAMGKRAALSIDNYLNKYASHEGLDLEIDTHGKVKIPGLAPSEIDELKEKYIAQARTQPKKIDLQSRRNSFKEVTETFSDEEAMAEAQRCLNCTICTICRECEKVCEAKAIDYNMKDEILEIEAGNIILATGFKPFDAGRIETYGYGKLANVITSLEFERMANASGPTGGQIVLREKDTYGDFILSEPGNKPERVAIIHCVGSRNENFNAYCSRVCCMYSLKIAHLLREKLPDAAIFEYYIDIRAFGKGYEEFYNRIQKEGIQLIRGLPSSIKEDKNGLYIRSEDIIDQRLIEHYVDMVILSVGLEPQNDAGHLSQLLDIGTDKEGWYREANYNTLPVHTHKEGIMIVGACQGPKDIPDSVAQGSAAASLVLQNVLIKT